MIIINSEPLDYSPKCIKQIGRWGEYKEMSWDDIDKCDDIECDILIVRLSKFIDSNVLDRFHGLKFILSSTTGIDHIDMTEIDRRSIKLVCLKGEVAFLESVTSTSELNWGLILSIIRNIPYAFDSVRQSRWDRDKFKGYQLKNKTIGIIGLGRVGGHIANYAKAFGMNVGYYDPYKVSDKYHQYNTLVELMQNSDIVSINCEYNDHTNNMIDGNVMSHIKRDAFIINTARGGIWCEECIVELLKSGVIRGVATDVLSGEMLDINQSALFRAMKQGYNIIITPHIGGANYDVMNLCEEFIVDKFEKKYLDENSYIIA